MVVEVALPTTTSAPSLLTRVILLDSVAIADDYSVLRMDVR